MIISIYLLFTIYLLLLLSVFLNGAVQYKKQSAPFKILIIFIGFTFITESISRILAWRLHNSMPIYHLVSPLEYTCFTLMYLSFFQDKKTEAIKYLYLPVIIFSMVNSFYIQGLMNFPSNSILLFQIIYLAYSLLGFKQLLDMSTKTSIRRQSFFWLNTALLFFSSTQLFFFGLLNYAIRHHLNLMPIYIFSYVINLIYYIFMAIAINTDRSRSPIVFHETSDKL
jgi:hypothetical protein